jgi:hypothetical protein
MVVKMSEKLFTICDKNGIPFGFFSDAKGEKIYTVGSPKFRKNLDDLQLIYNTKNCKLKSQMYHDLYERSAHLSFGDPDEPDYTNYEITSKYWYNFLKTLMDIKESLKICKNELSTEIMNKISKILDTSVWNLNLHRVGYSKKDDENLAKAKSNVKSNVRSEQLVIRKKLIEEHKSRMESWGEQNMKNEEQEKKIMKVEAQGREISPAEETSDSYESDSSTEEIVISKKRGGSKKSSLKKSQIIEKPVVDFEPLTGKFKELEGKIEALLMAQKAAVSEPKEAPKPVPKEAPKAVHPHADLVQHMKFKILNFD